MAKRADARVIGVRDLKAHASAVLREVYESGAEFIVSLHGRPIARIEPLPLESARPNLDGMGNSRASLADWPRLDWDDFVELKRFWQPASLDETHEQ